MSLRHLTLTVAAFGSFTSRRLLTGLSATRHIKPVPEYNYEETTPTPVVLYIRREEEVGAALQCLDLCRAPIGFDVQWNYINEDGQVVDRPSALVQLCDEKTILIIHVVSMKRFPLKLRAVLENPHITKLGVNVRKDAMKLYRDHNIVIRNLTELGALAYASDPGFAKAFNHPIVSLRLLNDFYLRCRIDKAAVRKTSWESALTPGQKHYAANNVYCLLALYKKIGACASTYCRDFNRLDRTKFTLDLALELKPPTPQKSSSSFSVMGGSGFLSKPQSNDSGTRTRQMRAYKLWRAGHGLLDICIKMGTPADPLQDSCVVSYIVKVLASDPSLPFSIDKLVALVNSEPSSWKTLNSYICVLQIMARERETRAAFPFEKATSSETKQPLL